VFLYIRVGGFTGRNSQINYYYPLRGCTDVLFIQGEPVSLSEALDSMCVTYSPTTKRLHKTTDSPRTPPPPSASPDLNEEKLKDRLKDECEYSRNSRKLRSSLFSDEKLKKSYMLF
jgi:hypothetical protein